MQTAVEHAHSQQTRCKTLQLQQNHVTSQLLTVGLLYFGPGNHLAFLLRVLGLHQTCEILTWLGTPREDMSTLWSGTHRGFQQTTVREGWGSIGDIGVILCL